MCRRQTYWWLFSEEKASLKAQVRSKTSECKNWEEKCVAQMEVLRYNNPIFILLLKLPEGALRPVWFVWSCIKTEKFPVLPLCNWFFPDFLLMPFLYIYLGIYTDWSLSVLTSLYKKRPRIDTSKFSRRPTNHVSLNVKVN